MFYFIYLFMQSTFYGGTKLFNNFSLGGVAVQFFYLIFFFIRIFPKLNIKIWDKWLTFVIFYLKGGKNQFLNVTKNLFLSDWYMMAKRKLVGGGLMNYSVKNSSYYNEIHKIINYI